MVATALEGLGQWCEHAHILAYEEDLRNCGPERPHLDNIAVTVTNLDDTVVGWSDLGYETTRALAVPDGPRGFNIRCPHGRNVDVGVFPYDAAANEASPRPRARLATA